jgi:hypothetical protein
MIVAVRGVSFLMRDRGCIAVTGTMHHVGIVWTRTICRRKGKKSVDDKSEERQNRQQPHQFSGRSGKRMSLRSNL